MDEKFINDFRNEIKDCIRFDEFVNQHLALIISRIYHAGCAAQSIDDRTAVDLVVIKSIVIPTNGTLHKEFHKQLAAAAIVENK